MKHPVAGRAVLLLLLLAVAVPVQAQRALPELSLEELMRIDSGRVFGASERIQPVTEALSADRPYRPSLPPSEVRRIIRAQAGTALCPEAVEALQSVGIRDEVRRNAVGDSDGMAGEVPVTPPNGVHAG